MSLSLPRRLRRPGWSLVETMVVLAIVCILTSLTFVMFSAAKQTVDQIEAQVQEATSDGEPVKVAPRMAKISEPADSVEIGDVIPDEYVVAFKDSVKDPYELADALAAMSGAEVLSVYHAPMGAAFHATAEQIAAIQASPDVDEVEPNTVFGKFAETVPTGIRRMSAAINGFSLPYTLKTPTSLTNSQSIRNLKNASSSSSSKVVVVIDSGIDSKHPDLNVKFTKGFGYLSGIDLDGHGTHVAGIIGAKQNAIGVRGVWPGVPLWGLRVLNYKGFGSKSSLISALNFCELNSSQIMVVNISMGGFRSRFVNRAVNSLVAKGVIVVAAAGNTATNAENISPASASSAITVAAMADSDGLKGGKGATTSFGDDDTFATFSNYGSSVSFIAPGVDIYSCTLNSGYDLKSGTSAAAPHVAGLAALIIVNPTTTGIRNVTGATGNVKGALRQLCSGTIAGRFDSLQYPLVAGLP